MMHFNEGWFKFARENGGAAAIGIGTNYFEAIRGGELLDYFRAAVAVGPQPHNRATAGSSAGASRRGALSQRIRDDRPSAATVAVSALRSTHRDTAYPPGLRRCPKASRMSSARSAERSTGRMPSAVNEKNGFYA